MFCTTIQSFAPFLFDAECIWFVGPCGDAASRLRLFLGLDAFRCLLIEESVHSPKLCCWFTAHL